MKRTQGEKAKKGDGERESAGNGSRPPRKCKWPVMWTI